MAGRARFSVSGSGLSVGLQDTETVELGKCRKYMQNAGFPQTDWLQDASCCLHERVGQ